MAFCLINMGGLWESWLKAIEQQTVKPDALLVIDSSSSDNTAALARAYGFVVQVIPNPEFNHGGTRQFGVAMLPGTDIVVFLTQDALLASPDAIERLLAAFADDRVGAAYGRQLPHRNAGPIAAHAGFLIIRMKANCARWKTGHALASKRCLYPIQLPLTGVAH